jgi:hypothetical protein
LEDTTTALCPRIQFGSGSSLRSGALAPFVRSVYMVVDVVLFETRQSIGISNGCLQLTRKITWQRARSRAYAAVGNLRRPTDDFLKTAPVTSIRAVENPTHFVLCYGDSYSIRGAPDQVAGEINRLHNAGFSAIGLCFVNYLNELPYFTADVIPRLERTEIRAAAEN